ncbi:MAG: SIS domain-containing protein [Gemmatimonadetes bacterium]|nr:SIS domain-containing protein [Gemmatimonadota bacterium]
MADPVNEAWKREASRELSALAELAGRVARDLSDDVGRLAGLVYETLRAGRKLLFCGNGGSAADAQHLAAEYVVRFNRARAPLAALALTTDTSLLTACGNDLGFEEIFARQVDALGEPGDLLILHSTSGRSPNLLKAADAARRRGVRTAALLAQGGGPLREKVDFALVVPTDSVPRAQELQLAIGHAICEIVDQLWAAEGSETGGRGGHGGRG